MADDELKRLLAGLLSDTSEETTPIEDELEETATADQGPGSVTRLEKHAIHLQTVSQVSQAASSLLDPEELLPGASELAASLLAVVDLIRKQFGFYHVGIFLVDDRGQAPGAWAVLRAGTGEPGRQMVAQGHRLRVGGDSMIGWCIAHKQARIALDVGKDAVHFDNPLLPNTRSEAALPLISRGRVIGAMSIQSTLPAAFDEDDTIVLQTMADQLANAIENARLYADAQQRALELAALLEVSTAASSLGNRRLDLGQVLHITAEQIARATNSDGCTLSRWDQRGDAVVTWIEVRLDDHEPDKPGTRYPLDDYPSTRMVLESRQPRAILADDPDADPAEAALMRKQGLSGLLMLPLIAAERVIGLVEVEQSQRARRFPPEPAEIRLCEALAHHAADAIEDARLSQERERRLLELAIVNEIGQALASSWELDTFLETVYWQVGRLFDTTNFYIATHEHGSHEWISALHVEHGQRQPTARYDVGAGLTGYIIRTRQPVLFCTLQENVAFKEAHGVEIIGEMARSWLGVPLVVADQVVGVMAIQDYEQENRYSDQDLTLFSTIAAQVANALANLRLLDEARHRAEEQAILLQVTEAIGRSLETHDLLDTALEALLQRMGFDAALVSLWEPDPGRLTLVAEKGLPEALARKLECAGLEGTLCEYVFDRGQTVAIGDIRLDAPIPVGGLIQQSLYGYAATPLIFKGERLGTICCFSRSVREMGDRELGLLQAIGRQVSIAVSNARLSEETQRRLRELSMLSELSQRLAGAPLDAQQIAEIIARLFVEVMGVPEASISLLDPERKGILHVVTDLYGEEGETRVGGQAEAFRLGDFPATARVLETKEPLVVQASDPDADPAELAYMQEYGTTTLVIIPLTLKGEAIGVVELEAWQEEHQFTPQMLSLATTLANQAAVALDNARLFEKEQRGRRLLDMRVNALDCLNEIGHKIDAAPSISEFLQWASSRIPAAMQYPDRCVVAIELEDRVYGTARARDLPRQMVQGLQVGGEQVGRITIAYTEDRDFGDDESALLGDISRRIGGYIQNVRLFEETQAALAEVEATHRSYLRRAWQDHLRQRDILARSSFLYDGTLAEASPVVSAVPDLWRPEIEQAMIDGDHAPSIVQDGDGDGEPAPGVTGGRTGLAVPIAIRGQTIGVLGVEVPDGHRQWTEDDLALIEAVSEQLAQTLETARLFADTQRRAERERLIAEVTAKIRASTDMHDILETTANELGRALGTSRALVRLGVGEPDPSRRSPPQGRTPPAGGPALDLTGGNGQPGDERDE
jgi:GAF domain-containing protein